MSKGAGHIGSRAVRAMVVGLLSRVGGVSGAQALKSGMRGESTAFWRARFAGKSPEDVRKLAEADMPPVHVTIFREIGRNLVVLEDGRHRLQAAREAGATRIRIKARIVGERGAASQTWTGVVRI